MIKDVCLVVPAYNPDEKLFLDFLDKAVKEFSNIIVINDGSNEDCDSIFKKIESQYSDIKILKHSVNLGKGRALKTAFNCYLNEYPDCIGIVQADCDGQHCIEDVLACAKSLKENPNCLILGARNFDEKDVPMKSKYGNKLTRWIFKLFIGITIKDTQTGLRGIGNELLKQFISTFGERYEYETNILIDCKANNIKIKEVPIRTIYIEKNQTSKFNPIKDSLMIYKLFAKYIFSSLSAFVIDIILFSIFINLFNNISLDDKTKILLATVCARIISSLYNFKINAKMVFKNMTKSSYIKYTVLVLIQMFVSAFGVAYFSKKIGIDLTGIKIFVDMVIFMVNFVVQREFVFKKK